MTTDRALLLAYASENISEVAGKFDDPVQKADAIMYCSAFCVGSLTEAELRAFYTSGGLDLTDYPQFEAAQDVTSVWVAAGGVEITDLLHGSLVDCDTPLVRKLQFDDGIRNRIQSAHVDGVMFRDFIMTGEIVL